HVPTFGIAGLVEAVAERSCPARGGNGRRGVNERDHRQRRLLRARRERPRSCRAAKRRQESSSSDVACPVTLRLGCSPIECGGGYHALRNNERGFCVAKGWSRRCLRWVLAVSKLFAELAMWRGFSRAWTILGSRPSAAGCP